MKRIFHTTIWESAVGTYYVGDVNDLGKGSNYWYNHARALGLKGDEYVIALIFQYKVRKLHFNRKANDGTGIIIFDFDDYGKASTYMKDVNAGAVKRQVYVG